MEFARMSLLQQEKNILPQKIQHKSFWDLTTFQIQVMWQTYTSRCAFCRGWLYAQAEEIWQTSGPEKGRIFWMQDSSEGQRRSR